MVSWGIRKPTPDAEHRSPSNVDMNFDKLEVCIKENALFRKKDLVQYKVNSEEIHELFRNHSVFPKSTSSDRSLR